MYEIILLKLLKTLVGAAGFELATPCAQGRCATRLRYAPTFDGLLILKQFLTPRTPRQGQLPAEQARRAAPPVSSVSIS
jgi:hypothetical protein